MEPKDFEVLKRTWYDKLKKEGFEDAETANGELKAFHSFDVHRTLHPRNAIVNTAREEYYRMAGQFLFSHRFPNVLYKFVWKSHSDGLSYRTIAKLVSDKFNVKATKWKINEIIDSLVIAMKKKRIEELNHEVE